MAKTLAGPKFFPEADSMYGRLSERVLINAELCPGVLEFVSILGCSINGDNSSVDYQLAE